MIDITTTFAVISWKKEAYRIMIADKIKNARTILYYISMSNQFDISLDTLLKENSKMVQSMDKERAMGIIEHEKSIVDFFTGAGTGIVVSYLFSPDSSIRTTVIIVGIIMIGIDWYKKSKSDKKVFQYIEQLKNIDMN